MADPRLVTAPRAAAVAGGGRTLRLTMWAMIATDVGFLIYWAVVATRPVPARLMFVEYADPRVQAWNWSFLPLDLAASLTGFAAASSVRRGGAQASARLALSLGLTATAGGWRSPTGSCVGSSTLAGSSRMPSCCCSRCRSSEDSSQPTDPPAGARARPDPVADLPAPPSVTHLVRRRRHPRARTPRDHNRDPSSDGSQR